MTFPDSTEHRTLQSAIAQSELALNDCKNKDYLPQLRRLHVWNLANMGDSLYKSGNHSEALSFYTKAIKVDCDEPSVLNQIGVCLILLGKLERALYYFEQLDRRSTTPEDKALALYNSGICHELSGNLNEAIISLRKSLRNAQDDATAEKLEQLKELNSRQAFRTFKYNVFSKNVLPEAKKGDMEPQRDRSKALGG